MRRILPGGARLGGSKRGGSERPVACRPLSAVLERTSHGHEAKDEKTDPPPPNQHERLSNVKLLLEIVAVVIGLIGALLALIAGFRK
jgi:hypothetical protein